MIGAFTYLVVTSARNQLRSRLNRLKNPRYPIALLLGFGYLWLVLFNRSAREGGQSGSATSGTMALAAPIGIFLYVAYLWILGADRTALAFTQAEVSMLFTAPVSRRGLIVYKLVRAQTAVIATSVIWLLLFGRGAGGFERVIGSWIFLSTLSLHRLGVALLRASTFEHGVKGLRRSWPAIALFGIAFAVVVDALLGAAVQLFSGLELSDLPRALTVASEQLPLNWILFPFVVAAAPMFAPAGEAFLRAALPALVLLALHVWWVLRSDSAFEEAAAEASAALALRRQTRLSRSGAGSAIEPKRVRRTFALRATGAPAVAIVWKNYLWIARTGQLRSLIGVPLVAAICALAFAGRSQTAEELVMITSAVLSVMIFLFGPMAMRNDLRGELHRLPMLKTIPLRGRQIVLAEVVSSASPTAAMQFLLVAVALMAMSFLPDVPLTVSVRIAALVTAPVLLLVLSIANFTIHNGLVLLFPGWVHLGEAGGGGIEATGQMMLTIIITMVMFVLLLIGPGGIGAVLFLVLRGWPALATVGVGVVSAALLGLESYLLIGLLGRAFDRLEPMDVG